METLCEFRGLFLDRKGILGYNRIDVEWVTIGGLRRKNFSFFGQTDLEFTPLSKELFIYRDPLKSRLFVAVF